MATQRQRIGNRLATHTGRAPTAKKLPARTFPIQRSIQQLSNDLDALNERIIELENEGHWGHAMEVLKANAMDLRVQRLTDEAKTLTERLEDLARVKKGIITEREKLRAETARIMQHVQPKEMARRIDGFKSQGLDPNEVKLILADVTFDNAMTIKLGGREVRLMYLGPGQQAGDTFVAFPHARALFTPGAFGKRSMPNMAFTPSVDSWVKLLEQVAAMDVDRILPAHGDVANRADVKELAAMLADEYATVKDAVAKGLSVDDAIKTLTFPQYKDWRNYNRLAGEIRALYELIQTGKRSYLE